MVNYVGIIDGISLYEDPYMEEDNKVLVGKKEGKKTFIVSNPKTANILYETYKRNLRKKKLERICKWFGEQLDIVNVEKIY